MSDLAASGTRAVSSPLAIRSVTLRNRIVGAPMERNYCDLSGRPTEQYAAYLEARAAGGAALLFTESSYVAQVSKARPHQMGMHADHVIPGVRRVADVVHRHGALMGVELNHAGRIVPSTTSQLQPVGPSAVACAEIGGATPRALSVDEIEIVVGQFAAAARRAVAAGADVLSVHGAHGYLIAQFLSPRSNRRDDEYGEPTLFLNRVVAAVREAVGETVPIFLRLSAFEGLPDGRDVEQSLRLVDAMALEHVDVVDLSAGTYGAGHWITPSGEVEEGYLADLAPEYRDRTGKLVSIAGRVTTPDGAERLVASGAVDLVCAARAFHADARWARHVLDGTVPRPCISCNQGCADVIFTGAPLWCASNPETGNEGVRRDPPELHEAGHAQVVVIGGGPAGLEAAATLAGAGHRVRLYEQHEHLGGQLAAASMLRAKPRFHRLVDWYERELARLDVDVRLGTRATPDQVAGADVVVVAGGGTGYVPLVPGIDNGRVVDVRNALASPPEEDNVVVWGADRAGVYTADHLASDGYHVTLVGSQSQLAPDAGARERLPAVERLTAASNVDLHLGCAVEEIRDDTVITTREGERMVIPAPGRLLVSQGTVPSDAASVEWREGVTAAADVYLAGEIAGGSTFDEAVRSGRLVADRVAEDLALRPQKEGTAR